MYNYSMMKAFGHRLEVAEVMGATPCMTVSLFRQKLVVGRGQSIWEARECHVSFVDVGVSVAWVPQIRLANCSLTLLVGQRSMAAPQRGSTASLCTTAGLCDDRSRCT